jgi:putative transposase
MTAGFIAGDELMQGTTAHPRYVVQGLLPRIQRVKVLDMDAREEKLLDEADVRQMVATGELRIRRNGVDLLARLHRRSAKDDQAELTAQKFLGELKSLMARYGCTFRRAHTMLVQEILPQRQDSDTKPFSLSQAYRLIDRERKGLPLHAPDEARGNRTRRYAPEIYEVVTALAEEHLLKTHSRWTWSSFADLVNLRLHEAGLLEPSKQLSMNFLKRVVRNEHADPDHKRMHLHDAIAAKAVARQQIRIASIFERVEQDALHLPWLIRTPFGDSTNVYLVHALDCSASFPMGWYLAIGQPRVLDTLMCIESILFPKAPRLAQLGLKYDFDVFGTPSLLVLDNGPENKGDRMLGLARLNITVNRLKARHAHQKPFIERMNKSLKRFLETIPGSTRLDGVDGKRDPAARGDPVMTLEEMEKWIVRFYFEHWVHKPLERLADSIFIDNEDLGNTPLSRYRSLTEERGCPIPLPPSLDAWRSTIFEPKVRTLSRKTGISYDNYQFRGDQLAHLIRVYGESPVTVLVNPDDFRRVYVVDRDGTTLVPLLNASASEITPGFSFDEARELLKEAEDHGDQVARENVRRDVLNRSVEKPSKTRSSKNAKAARSRQTTTQARRSGAVLRSADNPLPPMSPALGSPALGIAPDDDWSHAQALEMFDRMSGRSRS